MTVDELIKEIEYFIPDYSKQPESLKLIIGQEGYNGVCDDEKYCLNSEIKYYKRFKEVAFLLESMVPAPSELFILSVLFSSIDNAVEFLDKITTIKEPYVKTVEFLYFKYGIILINRKGKYRRFDIFKNENVTDILNIGLKPCPTIISHLNKCLNIPKGSSCLHCSPFNMATSFKSYFNIWFRKDEKSLKKIDGLSGNTSFKDFSIL